MSFELIFSRRRLATITLFLSFLLSLHSARSADPDIAGLFGGRPPRVEISARRALLRDEFGEKSPCYISIDDMVAVTVSEVIEVGFQVYGELLIWDLTSGRVRHSIRTPARIGAISGIRGSSRITIAGGPVNKDVNPPFVWSIDLKSGKSIRAGEPTFGQATKIQIRSAADGNSAIVADFGDRNGSFALYDFSKPGSAPRRAALADWNRLPANTSETANRAADIPSWIPYVGDRDRIFALAVDERGETGIWRSDTWVRVYRLGDRIAPWSSWSASPDGMGLVSWRPESTDGFTLWDFRSFRVTPVVEPGFRPEIPPAFSADGRFLRYKRNSKKGTVEIVSREVASGSESVAASFPADDFEHYFEARIRGTFSADGQHLLLSMGESEKAVLVSWNAAGVAAPRRLGFAIVEPVSVSDDGGTAVVTAGSTDKVDDVFYQLDKVDLGTGRRSQIWSVPTVGHTPMFSAAHHPSSGSVGMIHHTTGASLGYYAGDAVVSDGTPKPPLQVPGFETSADQEPLERDGHAWYGTFFRAEKGSAPHFGVFANNGRFVSFDPARKSIVHQFSYPDYSPHVTARKLGYPILKRIAATERGRVFLPVKGGGIRIVDLAPDGSGIPRADLWSLPDHGWFAVTPEGYYSISTGAARHVFFRLGESTFPFEQFDAFLNRPDKVAAALGAHGSEVVTLESAHRRRLHALGITDASAALDPKAVPEIELYGKSPITIDSSTITHVVAGRANAGGKISRILVSANGVPLFGKDGLVPKSGPAPEIEEALRIPIVTGENHLQISVRDSRGIESTALNFRVQRGGDFASEEKDLYLVSVGVSDYKDDSLDLDYSAKDAREIANAFQKAGAEFSKVHRMVIVDKDATRSGVLAARDFLRRSTEADRVIVFVAGHGVLSEDFRYYFCPHEFDPKNKPATGLSFGELESLFDGVAARERLLLMDTCQAGAVDAGLLARLEGKKSPLPDGVRAVVSPALRTAAATTTAGESARNQRFVEEIFADLRSGTGATVLSAAGGLEFALEGGGLSNGVFTHAVLETLRTPSKFDRDGDGTLRASELISHVGSRVSELTGGQQNPNARSVNLAVDFPVASPGENDGRKNPHDFLNRYLARSSNTGDGGSPVERVVAMFAERPNYFGKPMTHREILADIFKYNQKFDLRTYTLHPEAPVSSGTVGDTTTIDYTMNFEVGFFEETTINIPGRGPTLSTSRAFRQGTLKMHMGLLWDGRDFKITELKTR